MPIAAAASNSLKITEKKKIGGSSKVDWCHFYLIFELLVKVGPRISGNGKVDQTGKTSQFWVPNVAMQQHVLQKHNLIYYETVWHLPAILSEA